jgi:hypothetical protein
MAAVINSLFPQLFVYDQVAVYTQDFIQVFQQARAIKVVVKPDKKPMEHPLETGATTTDHVIITPAEIELSLLLNSSNYRDVYKVIKQFWLNSTLLVVQTKVDVFPNFYILSIPHEENPEQYDAIVVAMTLKQVQFATTAFSLVPKNPSNSTVVDRGIQTGEVTPVNESWLREKLTSGRS